MRSLWPRRNANSLAKDKKVRAYDRFVWESWMEGAVDGTPLSGRYRPGECFLDEFSRRTAS